MVNTQLKILRVFGPTGAEVSSVLRGIRDDGCPGLRLLERDGEFAICVQVSAPNRAMAEQYCDKWAARLRAKFGDDVFAEGETSLAQATLDALLEKRKLLVAVDEPTGRLLGSLLQPLPHSEAVFDFGTESYADPQKSRRITVRSSCSGASPATLCRPQRAVRWPRCRSRARITLPPTCPPASGSAPLCWCVTAAARWPAPCRPI